MDLVLDSLSILLLGAISTLALVHIVLLRKPEPSTHPLILGRQSDLDKVRRPNESPVFISATSGLGGQAKQLVKSYKSIHDIYASGTSPVVYIHNTTKQTFNLAEKVRSLSSILRTKVLSSDQEHAGISIKLDEPTDAFLAVLSASQASSDTRSSKAPLVLVNDEGIRLYGTSTVITSSTDLEALPGSSQGELLIINNGPTAKRMAAMHNPPTNWKILDTIETQTIGASTENPSESAATDAADTFVRMQVVSDTIHGIVDIAHRNILQGGLISLLSIFPPASKPSSEDVILSFESTSTPYGLTIPLMAASSGATFRLASVAMGIVTPCRLTSPTIIFCTPNELNAFKAAVTQVLPKDGAGVLYPLARMHKMSLLKAGSVSKSTLSDKAIFSKISEKVVGTRLKCIVCSAEEGAGPSAETVDFMRLVFGVPVIIAMTHPLVVGPVTNTMYHDLQRFPESSTEGEQGAVHVGAPSTTLECKLLGLSEDDVNAGVYRGELTIRGPSVLRNFTQTAGASDITLADGWLRTGVSMELARNGTLKPIKKLH